MSRATLKTNAARSVVPTKTMPRKTRSPNSRSPTPRGYFGAAPPLPTWIRGTERQRMLTVCASNVVSAQTEKVVEFFLKREAAGAMIGEVREDEPVLVKELRVETIELG